ncbi:MAG: neutral zinc metallopeptidase [Xanthomonadaceae bacterium]|nr:neutral zinc metallopeptidase [Xanthomonadaceae bacterium]
MDWNKGRRSSNVEDRRTGGGGGKLGIGAMLAVVVVSVLLGKNPIEMLGLIEQSGVAEVISGTAGEPAGTAPPADDREAEFVARILGDTEDVWGAIFQQSGRRYGQPTLVLFAGRVRSACGGATAATGPFYCPADQQVYLDTSFFSQLRASLGGGGDFAEAYVIAHEVGHHVQTLLGVSAEVNKARQRGDQVLGDGGLLVRQELQADCLAGVWAHHAQARHQWLDAGDLAEALNTASAIGDDHLQKQAQGTVVPDAFSHGTSAQRVRWFKAGFEGGDVAGCDTFSAKGL